MRLLSPLLLALVLGTAAPVFAQDDPFREGPVVDVAFIRTEPGQFDNYMAYIFGDYARLMEAYKEAGLILDWGVLSSPPGSPDDHDIVLTTTYANMAALDNLDERTRPIVERVMRRNRTQAAEASAQRGVMRQLMGNRLYRVLMPR